MFTLDEIFGLADRNSKTLRPSFTAIDEAHEAVRVAKNDRLPDIDASLSFSYLGDGTLMERDFTQVERAPMPHFGNNFALEVSQIIYSGGAVSNGIAIAQLQEQNARLDWAKDRNKMRFLLAGYYFDLFKQLNLIKVYEQNIEQTKQLLKDIRTKQGEGLALKNDITRYELLLSDLEFTVVQIKNTLGILNRNLVTNLGLDESVWIEPDTTLLSRTLPMGDAAYWQNEAMENSPELKQLALAVQMNKHQDKIVKSDRLPKIALMAGNHFDGPIASALVARVFKMAMQSNYYTLGGTLDAVNPLTGQVPFSAYFGELQRQATLVSIKQVFGYAVLLGILFLIVILFTRYARITHRVKLFRVPVVGRLFAINLSHERMEERER